MKLRKKNEDGKYITKDIPDNLVATYLQIGWEKVVENNTKVEKKNILNNKIKNND